LNNLWQLSNFQHGIVIRLIQSGKSDWQIVDYLEEDGLNISNSGMADRRQGTSRLKKTLKEIIEYES